MYTVCYKRGKHYQRVLASSWAISSSSRFIQVFLYIFAREHIRSICKIHFCHQTHRMERPKGESNDVSYYLISMFTCMWANGIFTAIREKTIPSHKQRLQSLTFKMIIVKLSFLIFSVWNSNKWWYVRSIRKHMLVFVRQIVSQEPKSIEIALGRKMCWRTSRASLSISLRFLFDGPI